MCIRDRVYAGQGRVYDRSISCLWASPLRIFSGGRFIASLCEGGVSYSGIAAEIGAKNMPPACFLNAPTEGENKNLKFSPPVSLALDSHLSEGAKE